VNLCMQQEYAVRHAMLGYLIHRPESFGCYDIIVFFPSRQDCRDKGNTKYVRSKGQNYHSFHKTYQSSLPA
jgi:hypothetical protein